MKMKHILIFIISISFASSFSVVAQEENTAVNDTINKNDKYGLRVGLDLAKPLRSFLEDDYTGFEVMADFRISKKFYAAVELGNEEKDRFEENLKSSASGSYAKIGGNFNAYNNWLDMNNEIFLGLRYSFSLFDQTLNSYTPNVGNVYFPADTIPIGETSTGLTAHWTEFVVGMKAEVLKNLFVGASVSYKIMLSVKDPENFKTLYVPGFNRVFESNTGFGFNYTLSYIIPFFKK